MTDEAVMLKDASNGNNANIGSVATGKVKRLKAKPVCTLCG